MLRQMIKIDDALCNGCGKCVKSCAEGAIAMVDHKAKVVREDYCDGLGACLPVCPVDAISFEMREALPFVDPHAPTLKTNWPLQIQLTALTSPAYDQAHLLIAADCTAFASPSIYTGLSAGRVVLIGCPKLDRVSYASRLGSILKANDILDVTVLRMDVPCCGGMSAAVAEAIELSGKDLPLTIHVLHRDGTLK